MDHTLHNLVWMDETLKSGYQNFMDKMVHDSIWNAKSILTKYGKKHWARDVAFEEVILKVVVFVDRLQSFTKSCNRFGSVGWWIFKVGIVEEASQRHNLIPLLDTARVLALDNHHGRGGYTTIRRVRIM
jgi:hypothetical protein